jgi:hypothetical protein
MTATSLATRPDHQDGRLPLNGAIALPRQQALPLSLGVVVVLSAGALAVAETAEAEVVEVVVTFLDSAPAVAVAVAAAAGTYPHQHCSVELLVPMVLSMLGLASNSHHRLTLGSPYSPIQQQL